MITDEQLQATVTGARTFTLVILRRTARYAEPGTPALVKEGVSARVVVCSTSSRCYETASVTVGA